jgi:branched-chain amino acid transport system ATP-binding protein
MSQMLELTQITAGYAGSTVLHEVDLSVPAASVVALLGPNGAGKTTLLRVAARTLAASSGSITFDGSDVTKSRAHELARAGICYIPEGRGVFPALTVRDHLLLFGARSPAGSPIDTAIEAFPFFERRLNSPARNLSGGELQMLALARAWLTKPKVVLLDEVSMGLGPMIVDDVYAFMRRLAADGISLLIVEQYVQRISEFADHIYLLRNGRVTFSGPPGDLGSQEEILGHYLGSAKSA